MEGVQPNERREGIDMNRTKEELYALESEAHKKWKALTIAYGEACKTAQAIFIKQEQVREEHLSYTHLIRDYDKLTRTSPLDVD
jgi:hypothetical protein